jgi:hypothetical protein
MVDRRLRKILIAGSTVLSLTMLLAMPVRSSSPADLGCRSAVERRLTAWGAGAERYRDADGPFGAHQWRLPTHEIGTWVLLHEAVNEMPSLARIDARSTTRVTFDGECREASSSEPHAAPEKDAFTDDDVRSLVAANAQGVIFVWSPHMPLSVDAYRTVAAVARRLQLSFTTLRDPMADAAYAEGVAREAELPASALRTFASVELSFRQATLHSPSLLVFARGRFAGLAVPGYREAAGFEAAISERLRALSAAGFIEER